MRISMYINVRICVFILGKPSPYDNSDTSKRMVDQSDYSQTVKVRNPKPLFPEDIFQYL